MGIFNRKINDDKIQYTTMGTNYDYKNANSKYSRCLNIIFGREKGNLFDALYELDRLVKENQLTEKQITSAKKILKYNHFGEEGEKKSFDFDNTSNAVTETTTDDTKTTKKSHYEKKMKLYSIIIKEFGLDELKEFVSEIKNNVKYYDETDLMLSLQTVIETFERKKVRKDC